MNTNFSPPLRAALLVALMFSFCHSAIAQNTGMRIRSTVHRDGDPVKELTQRGGIAVTPKVFDPTDPYVVGFWLRRDGGDETTGGSLWSTASTQVVRDINRSLGSPSESIPDDDEWHYFMIAFDGAGGAEMRVDGDDAGPVSDDSYLDVFGLGAAGLFDSFGGVFRKNTTKVDVVVDDISVWKTNGQDVISIHNDIVRYGMSAMPEGHPKRVAYYDCSEGSALQYYEDAAYTGVSITPANLGDVYDVAPVDPILIEVPAEKPIRFHKIEIVSAYGVDQVTPRVSASGDFGRNEDVTFSAPKWVYLDRHKREIDPALPNAADLAFYRAEFDSLSVEGIDDPNLIGNDSVEFSVNLQSDIKVTWNWKLQAALFVEAATSGIGGLAAPGSLEVSIEGESQATLSKYWVDIGLNANVNIADVIESSGAGGTSRFRTTGYYIDNDASSSDRYAVFDELGGSRFSGGFGSLTANADLSGDFTFEFWARGARTPPAGGGTEVLFEIANQASNTHLGIGVFPEDHEPNPGGMFLGMSPSLTGSSHPEATPLLAQVGGAVVQDGLWHHWAWAYDESAQIVSVFRDGLLLTSFPNVSIDVPATNNIGIGIGFSRSATQSPFIGGLNNVRLWSSSLDTAKVAEMRGTAVVGGGDSDLLFEAPLDTAAIFQTVNGVSAGSLVLESLPRPTHSFYYKPNLSAGVTPSGSTLHGSAAARSREVLLTPAEQNQTASMVIDDFSDGESMISLEARFDLHILDGGGEEADGVSFNFGQVPDTSINALGAGSGVAVSFIPYLNPRIEIRMDGVLFKTKLMPTLSTAAPVPVRIVLSGSQVAVYYNDVFQVEFFNAVPLFATGNRVAFGAHTGGATARQAISNINLSVSAFDPDYREVSFPRFSHTTREPGVTGGGTFSSGDLRLDDWIRLTWTFDKEHLFRVRHSPTDSPGVTFDGMPYLIVTDKNGTATHRSNLADGVWVPDLGQVKVGAQYRTADRCFTLSAVSGATGSFATNNFNLGSMRDGTVPGGSAVSREFDVGSDALGDGKARINQSGDLVFVYAPTVYKAEIPLGSGLDVRDLATLNSQLTPALCDGGALDLVSGPGEAVLPPNLDIGQPGEMAQWDPVGLQLLPLSPGVFRVSWPDPSGGSHEIEVASHYPTEMANLNWQRENAAGQREGAHPAYVTQMQMPDVSEAFPASPVGHYRYAFGATAGDTPVVQLDPSAADRWHFLRMTHTDADDPATVISQEGRGTFAATARAKAVMLYNYHPEAGRVAGGTDREAFATRVVTTSPVAEVTQADDVLSGGQRGIGNFAQLGRLTVRRNTDSDGPTVAFNDLESSTLEFWHRANPHEDPENLHDLVVFEQRSFASGAPLVQRVGFRGAGAADAGTFFISEDYDFTAPAAPTRVGSSATNGSGWHHFAITWNPAAMTLKLYKDGRLHGQGSNQELNFGSAAPYPFVTIGGSISTHLSHLGELDNLRFWSKALSAVEIRAVMDRSDPDLDAGATQPLINLHFDDALTEIDDISGESVFYDNGIHRVVGDEGYLATTAHDGPTEVATRIRSKLDTGGLGSGFLYNRVSNHNANLYDRGASTGEWGPIFPVNWSGAFSNELLVGYFENPFLNDIAADTQIHPNVHWPYTALQYDNVDFPADGEDKDGAIYISSRLGSEGVDVAGVAQKVYDPATYEQLAIYHQPDRAAAGFNPNEEHALVETSVAAALLGDPAFDLGQSAAFALQSDLNVTARTDTNKYTSDPWVLVQVTNKTTGEPEMAAYKVLKTRPANPEYKFQYGIKAGDLVIQPYPLNRVVGNLKMADDKGGNIVQESQAKRTLWFDKNDTAWCVSGEGQFFYEFWYPFRDEFWYDLNGDNTNDVNPGHPIAWVPTNSHFVKGATDPQPERVLFNSVWGDSYPKLKRGESITYSGGENRAENPLDTGLPAIVAMASTEVVYDTSTPSMLLGKADKTVSGTKLVESIHDYSARITRPLDRFEADFAQADLPSSLTPASSDVMVVGPRYYFKTLTGSLQKRFYYDSLRAKLVFRGRLNDLEGGDPDLTATPVDLFALEPNVMTPGDYSAAKSLASSDSNWTGAIDKIFKASQDPTDTAGATITDPAPAPSTTAPVYYAGIQKSGAVKTLFYESKADRTPTDVSAHVSYAPLQSLGSGSALVANPKLLSADTAETSYVTVAENNHADIAGAVALHIIEIVPDRLRGAIKVIEAQDVFDEKINLKHTADFGGNTSGVYYEWWVRNTGNLGLIGTPDSDSSWQLYQGGLGLNSIKFAGRPDITLADKLFYVRYGERAELAEAGGPNVVVSDPEMAFVTPDSWRLVDINSATDNWEFSPAGDPVPFQWAGAANSPQLQADGSKRYIPQLVMGWVKRVLDRINPYEARFTDFYNNESPATYTSMLQIAGKPFNGAVALNSDKNVIENVGLIELYETVLARAKALTLNPDAPAADSGTNQAVLLAATRLAVLYELVAREAYSDAQNPTVPVTDENGLLSSASFAHAFMNQESGLLHEELALLRGTDFLKAYPSFNRLAWNYVKGLGEAAYNSVYNVTDANSDGFINEFDAATLYPMGHGDAWGHFLSANNMHYALLGHPTDAASALFAWEARSELYSLLGNVIEADYLDEQTFARIAAAKARTGLEIVKATYREAFTSDPDGQWQGYTDPADPARAWGVSEWSKRSGQAALFDWFAANAVVPADADSADPNNSEDTPTGSIVENLDQLDRQTNRAELGEITGALVGIQLALDNANLGATPLGLDPDALIFDLDPLAMAQGETHFEQVYDQAVQAGQSAVAALEFASKAENQLRRIADDSDELKVEALKQDIDYRNRLIEIFGTPYDGTVGPGKVYAEGYEGPDTLLYFYMDRTDTSGYVPDQASGFVTLNSSTLPSYGTSGSYSSISFNTFWGDDSLASRSALFDRYDLDLTDEFPTLTTSDLEFPTGVNLTAGHAFKVPADENWGRRTSTGRIQMVLHEMLAEQIALERSAAEYQAFIDQAHVLARRLQAHIESQELREQIRISSTEAITASRIVEAVGKATSLALQFKWDAAWQISVASAEFLPQSAGVSSDFTSSARGGLLTGGTISAKVIWGIWAAAILAENAAAAAAEVSIGLRELDFTRINEFLKLNEIMTELSLHLAGEKGKRLALTSNFKRMETLAAELRSTTAEGFRLLDEREAFNKSVAASSQRGRYGDMMTRISRNDALRNYQSAYDNALRYAWLAAKAYDYETSLATGDPAAVTSLLDSLVKERQLGLWNVLAGGPQIGNGGLAETLAQMKGNFDALEGQLGINNPQLETGQLSLRHENFRIARDNAASNSSWKRVLQESRVDDLWKVPEFREFCRPFADPTDGAQPGLVIELSTEINPGKNFFGRELGGGDHAYSTANFATKLSSLGVWFEGYNHTGLSTTPRVYLVPVGNDVLRVSNADTPEERRWNVVEQRIPTPYILNEQNLTDPGFIPSVHGLDGVFGERNRIGDFRAYHTEGGGGLDPAQMTTSSRLVGRSVWNTRWLLIVPGATLHADAKHGLDQFVDGVDDIKLQFETYTQEGN